MFKIYFTDYRSQITDTLQISGNRFSAFTVCDLPNATCYLLNKSKGVV